MPRSASRSSSCCGFGPSAVPSPTGTAGAALAIGFTLLGAWIFGDVLRRFRLPRLTGYILFGILIGPSVGDVITETMAVQLHFVTGIATTLIALIAGLTLNLERLGHAVQSDCPSDGDHACRGHGRDRRRRVDRVAVALDRPGGEPASSGSRSPCCWS